VRVLVLAAIAACAPSIDGPTERQRVVDRADEGRLATQLAQLPGAIHAEVALHRSVVDPFTQQRSPASAAVVLVVDDRADRAALTTSARHLVRATAPELPEPLIAIELGATRPELARLGPFTVEARSKSRLVGVLAATFAVIALLAGWIAWRERPAR
jgi:type III secretory pathway lipoprotein EscJ